MSVDVLNAGLNDEIIQKLKKILGDDFVSENHSLPILRESIRQLALHAGDASYNKQQELLTRLNDLFGKQVSTDESIDILESFIRSEFESSNSFISTNKQLLESIQGQGFETNQHSLVKITERIGGIFPFGNGFMGSATISGQTFGSSNLYMFENLVLTGNNIVNAPIFCSGELIISGTISTTRRGDFCLGGGGGGGTGCGRALNSVYYFPSENGHSTNVASGGLSGTGDTSGNFTSHPTQGQPAGGWLGPDYTPLAWTNYLEPLSSVWGKMANDQIRFEDILLIHNNLGGARGASVHKYRIDDNNGGGGVLFAAPKIILENVTFNLPGSTVIPQAGYEPSATGLVGGGGGGCALFITKNFQDNGTTWNWPGGEIFAVPGSSYPYDPPAIGGSGAAHVWLI